MNSITKSWRAWTFPLPIFSIWKLELLFSKMAFRVYVPSWWTVRAIWKLLTCTADRLFKWHSHWTYYSVKQVCIVSMARNHRTGVERSWARSSDHALAYKLRRTCRNTFSYDAQTKTHKYTRFTLQCFRKNKHCHSSRVSTDYIQMSADWWSVMLSVQILA